jgi:outer membrane protein assembly factor BamB
MVGSAAVRDGRALVGSDSGKIIAADLQTGRKLWEFASGAKVRCSPAVAGGLVYCGSDSGAFHALETDTGKKCWSFEAGGPVQASPAVVGGIVLFGANDHHVYALDRFTGKKLWSFKVNDYILQAPPVVHGDQVFVGQWTDWVWALDLKTGKLRWKTFIPVTIEALAYHRDKLYVRNPNWIVEVDPKTGRRLRVGMASWGWGGPAFVNNLLFQTGIQSQYGTSGGTVTDLDDPGNPPNKLIPTLEEVRLLKRTNLKGGPELGGMGTPLALGDKLCFATVAGKLIVTDLDSTRRWTYQLGGTCHATPVAADGTLLVGCDDGHLYAFHEK